MLNHLNHKVFVIAEAGVNHNGSLTIAKKMIDVAACAGADAVKFQTFRADNLVVRSAEKAQYQIANTGLDESQYAMLKRLELNRAEFKALSEYAKKKRLVFLSSPFDKESVDLLYEIGVAAFKIASGELTNLPLIKYIAKKHKPIILSTGMANLSEIKEALKLIRKQGAREVILLHCVTDYPAKFESVNLKAMQTLRDIFKIPVGLSDHTSGIMIPIAAAAMGACIIEKHFTLDKNLPGPDHEASLDPDELEEMVKAIRCVKKAMGNGIKKPTKSEERIKKIVRRSIVARVNIHKGTRIAASMLDIKRPGTGIAPKFLVRLVGKNAKRDIKQDALLNFKDLV